jgi:hypothetical protein
LNAIDDVFRIAVDLDIAWAFEFLEGGDHPHEFHPIIRSASKAPGELFSMLTEYQHCTVPAWAWIGFRCAIGVDNDAWRG